MTFIEANAHVTHVLSFAAQSLRQLAMGLLDALNVVALSEDDSLRQLAMGLLDALNVVALSEDDAELGRGG